MCTCHAARGNGISTCSSSCLIHTCERGCLLIFSKKYDVYRTFTRMLAVRAQKLTHISSFVFHCRFLCQLHAHTYANQNVLAETVFCCFPRNVYIILTMPMFVGSQNFISTPSFMFVGDAVSEICESNRNKKEKQNGFNTFPGT